MFLFMTHAMTDFLSPAMARMQDFFVLLAESSALPPSRDREELDPLLLAQLLRKSGRCGDARRRMQYAVA
jgi:hypothetical protein